MTGENKPKRKALHRGIDDAIPNPDAQHTSKLLHKVAPPLALSTPIMDLPQSPTRSEIDRAKIDRPKFNRSKAVGPDITPQSESSKGFLALPHEMTEQILPTLSTTEQVVLLRLFRLSRGFGSDTCEVGQGTLQKACNVTRNTLKSAISALIEKGHIERLEIGAGPESSVYRINIAGVSKFDRPKIDRSKIDRANIGRVNSSRATIDEHGSEIDTGGRSKFDPIINNHAIEKHTQTQNVSRVSSRFSLEQCRRYANHLKATGQGITNPGGYATKIFRSGEADEMIEIFVKPVASLDINQCPDCRGTGFIYIDTSNHDKGVRPCKHEPLKQVIE